MPLTIHLHSSERQTAFNLERWRELLADRVLARLPHRIETDRHGHILMSLPPAQGLRHRFRALELSS